MGGAGGNKAEAMDDLRRILESRAAFYAKADRSLDTSDKTAAQALAALQKLLQDKVPLAA